MINNVTVFNIRNCFSGIIDGEIGENAIQDILSDFSCSKNPDIEKFLKAQSTEFTKKNQSVTYLVFSNDDAALLGYFTLTIKPISINPDHFSNTVKRRIARVSTQNHFKRFDVRETKYCTGNEHKLVQLLKVL
ncbi:MAG: hypothetical protein LIP11_13630 [Clostridiales bacterium]|nr:hypothetical protein [Clostridiales bacterium]